MKVLVCGGRDYDNRDELDRVLDKQHKVVSFTHLIHGGCSGADRLAGAWAKENGVQTVVCEPQWDKLGRGAGPIRNRRMIELKPDLVIAFPGGKGTKDMVGQAVDAGDIQVYVV